MEHFFGDHFHDQQESSSDKASNIPNRALSPHAKLAFAHFAFRSRKEFAQTTKRKIKRKSLNYKKIEIGTFLAYTKLFSPFADNITHDLFERKDIPRHVNQCQPNFGYNRCQSLGAGSSDDKHKPQNETRIASSYLIKRS